MADEMGWREKANVLAWLLNTHRPNYANELNEFLKYCEYDASRDMVMIWHPRVRGTIQCRPGHECVTDFRNGGFDDNPRVLR